MSTIVRSYSGSSGWVNYFTMTKPTISLLVMISSFPTMISSFHGIPSWQILLATCVGIFLMSGSASAFNQIIELNIDLTMIRTRKRSLPSGIVSKKNAIIFACVLLLLGFSLLANLVNLEVALSLLPLTYYMLCFTP